MTREETIRHLCGVHCGGGPMEGCDDCDIIRRAVDAGIALGKAAAMDECQTCGCTGVMTVDEGEGGPPPHEETCAECNGTGIGAFGQMLRDAKAAGAAEERAAVVAYAHRTKDCLPSQDVYWKGYRHSLHDLAHDIDTAAHLEPDPAAEGE